MTAIIDEYSRFPVIEFVLSPSANNAIRVYDKIFATFGIPKKIKSDNGSPNNSIDFGNYMK